MATEKPNLFYMKFCPKDFVSDPNVAAMTISERGAYIMLLCYCWMADEPGFLKDDDKLLAKLSGAGRSWSKVKEAVKGAFKCDVREGYLCQTRILSEYNNAVAETAQNKANGLKGAQKRWGDHSPPNGDPNSEAIASYSNSNSNRKKKDIEEAGASSCSEPQSDSKPDDPVLLRFDCNGPVKDWNLTQSKVDEWSDTYEGVDIVAECKKARQWIFDNRKNRKTAKGMPRFLGAWIARSIDRPGNNGKSSNDVIDYSNAKPPLPPKDLR